MEVFNYLWFVLYGLIAGVLAKTVFPGKDEGGLFLTVALGICGSILGGLLFPLFGWPVDKGFSLNGLIPAFFGSIVILVGYQFILKRFS